jgi:hypothetical protein
MDAGFSYGHWNVRGDKALILGPAPGGGQGLFVCGADGANPNWLNKVKGEVVAAVWCARMD